MCRGKPVARNLTHAGIVSLLLIVSCWTQKPEGAQTAVPPLPANIPGDAEHYSVLITGNLAGQQAVWNIRAVSGIHKLLTTLLWLGLRT
jgi:hypothetical protein